MKYLPFLGLVLILLSSIEPKPEPLSQESTNPEISTDYNIVNMAASIYDILTAGCQHETMDHSNLLVCWNQEEELYN